MSNQTENLSLKSLYKFLTISDYPVYSDGIIKKDNRIGLTLTKFCHENILLDFKKRKIGKVIWRTEGGRNRYISEICNRSRRLGIYKEYAEEVAAAANAENLLRQIRQFMFFLKERHYNYEAFDRKLPAYIELFAREDDAFSEKAYDFFQEALAQKKELEGQGEAARGFCCGWFLAFFMLHALMGNGEGESSLQRIRSEKELSLKELHRLFCSEGYARKSDVVYLTSVNTELNCPPLKQGHFFGREEELFDLREMLVHGGKYLISGIGGVGKTELMRQFLKHCEEEGLTDCICVVQYEGSLAKSLVKAFPQIQGPDGNENFKEALAQIRMHAGKRVLFAIDNVDASIEETELEALRKLPITIFMTSRYQKLKGFKTYRLKAISKEAGSLIFRDNYGSGLSLGDRETLEEIVSKDLWCHTLTLRLLARTAKHNGWSLAELLERLEKGKVPNDFTEQEQYEGLKQVYHDMYALSGLPDNLKSFLKFFAALPYQSYRLPFLEKYLRGFWDKDADMEAELEKLWVSGWLEKQENGYSMHPFIAECVLSTPIGEEDCRSFYEKLVSDWQDTEAGFCMARFPDMIYNWDREKKAIGEELLEATMLFGAVATKLSGRLSETTIQLILLAAITELNYYGVTKVGLEMLLKLRKKVGKLSEETRSCLNTMLCCYNYDILEYLREEFARMQEQAEIPMRLKCSFAESLGVLLYNAGHHEEAEATIDYALENCADDDIHTASCIVKANLQVQAGDFNAYGEWLKKGVALGLASGREMSKDMQLLLSGLCSLYIAMGRFDEAERVLAELDKTITNKTFFVEYYISFYRGSLAMHRGDEGYGIAYLEEANKCARNLFSGIEDVTYAVTIVELAMAYNKNGQYEQAAKAYREALDIYNMLDGHVFERHRILNNMGVMYLDTKQPKEALICLTEALSLGEVLGGLAEGENLNNLSKAWRLLGDRERELEYLTKAVPVLEQFYGSEHPKVVDAKKRLGEEIGS